jgi:hypothetical protein
MYDYEAEKYKDIDLFTPTMLKYGYLLSFDGKIVIPEREESDYLPYKDDSSTNKNNENQDLPF